MEARLILPKFYAIVDRETLDARGITVRVFAEQLRDGGVLLLQYRDKKNGPQEVLRAAGEIAEVFAGTGAALVMNDRADLAALLSHSSREKMRDESGTQVQWGVHVGQGDLPVEAVWRVLGIGVPHSSRERMRDEWATRDGAGYPSEIQGSLRSAAAKSAAASVEMTGVLVGVSTHNMEQVAEADRNAASYVAVGPVFATASKENPEPVVGLEGVRIARSLTSKPLVAIGGLTLENARSMMDAGADSLAVIGGLFVPGRSVADVARDFLELLG